MPGPALHFDGSFVLVRDPPHEAQPQTGSVNLRRAGSVGAVEAFEYVWHDVGRHTYSGVPHREFRGTCGPRDRHDNGAAGRSEFDRVINEVRAQRIMELPLDLIPNPRFSRKGAEKAILGPMPESDSPVKKARRPSGLPPYLTSLYEMPLLTREQEAQQARQIIASDCR